MNPFPIGGNIQAYDPSIKWSDTLDYWAVVRPAANVVTLNSLNDRDRIFEAQRRWPDTLVIARLPMTVKNARGEDSELDGGLHLKPLAPGDTREYLVSPFDYMNAIQPLAEKGAVLYWGNEPSGEVEPEIITALVKHTVEGIRLADERGKSLCVLNWGVGHPYIINGALDRRFLPVIEALAKAKRKHYWGLHLYLPVDSFRALEALETLCIREQIDMPECIITEWGYDVAYGGDTLNGYKTRVSGLELAAVTIENVKNKWRRYFEEGKLKAVIGFCEGGEPRWHNWNWAYDAGYKDRIKTAAINGELALTIKTITGTFPKYYPRTAPVSLAFDALYRVTLPKSIAARNIRALPELASDDLGDVLTGNVIQMWAEPTVRDTLQRVWNWVQVIEGDSKGIAGWMMTNDVSMLPYQAPPVENQIPAPLPIPSVPPSPAPNPGGCPETFNTTLTREQMAAIATKFRSLAGLLTEIADIISPDKPEGVQNALQAS